MKLPSAAKEGVQKTIKIHLKCTFHLNLDLIQAEIKSLTHTLKRAALQPVMVLVLQQLKTQVPGEARRNAFTACKQTYLL